MQATLCGFACILRSAHTMHTQCRRLADMHWTAESSLVCSSVLSLQVFRLLCGCSSFAMPAATASEGLNQVQAALLDITALQVSCPGC
jgi:hypothetical protein